MPSELRDLEVEFVSLVDRAAVRDPVEKDQPMRFLVWKRSNEGDRMTPEEQKDALEKAQADATTAAERDTAKAELTKAQEQIETLTKSIEDIKKAAGVKEEPVAVDKSDWPESARVAFEKAEEERAADRERAEKAEQRANAAAEKVDKAEDARLTREAITKAEKFKALPIDAAKFGPILKSASEKLSKEENDELDRVLKAADEGLQKSDLFKTVSGNGNGEQPDTALGQAKAKAAELCKADPALTEATAMQRVLKADNELAARYQDEVRAA